MRTDYLVANTKKHEGKTLADILGDALRRRHGNSGFNPCGGEIEDDGFITVYSSVPVYH